MSQGNELKFQGGAATNPEREQGNEGGKKRDHAHDGMAAAHKSLGFSAFRSFEHGQPSHAAKKLAFFGVNAGLAEPQAFATFLAPLKRCEWVVYSKKPFGGPEAVLAYLSRYTHRVAISNRRLVAADAAKVSFKYKDYRPRMD